MPTRASCPACGATYTVPDNLLGKQIACRRCKEMFRLPTANDEPPSHPRPKAALPDANATASHASPSLNDALKSTKESPQRDLKKDSEKRGPERTNPARGVANCAHRNRERDDSAGPDNKRSLLVACGAIAAISVAAVLAFILWPKTPEPAAVVQSDTDQSDNTDPHPAPEEGDQADSKQPAPEKAKDPIASQDLKVPVDLAKNDEPALPEAPDPLAIAPPPLTQAVETIKLPGWADDLRVGGAGRFFIFKFPHSPTRLGIFDLNQAKFVKFIPLLGEGRVSFAAGKSKLMVIQGSVIDRYSLETFEREFDAPLPFTGWVLTAAMGSASEGPLLVHRAEGDVVLPKTNTTFIDIDTLKIADIKIVGTAQGGNAGQDDTHFRASADGTVFGFWCCRKQGTGSIVLANGTATKHWNPATSGYVDPNADGKLIYTAIGAYTPQLKPLFAPAKFPKWSLDVPSISADFFLKGPLRDPFGVPPPGPVKTKAELSIVLKRPETTLAKLEVNLRTDEDVRYSGRFSLDQRIHFVPAAETVVVLGDSSNHVIELHRVDLNEALEKSGIDYLLVTSLPPCEFVPGKPFRRRISVKSKAGEVRYKLGVGPPGMTIARDGWLSWAPPVDIGASPVEVQVVVTDLSSQETTHSFQMRAKKVVPETKKDTINVKNSTLELPGTAGDLCLGANGRFIIMHFPQLRELVAFDVAQAKIVKRLPVEENIVFTAGLNDLFIGLQGKKLIERYSLTNFEKVTSAPSPVEHMHRIATGHASNGPLLVAGEKLEFCDPKSLDRLELRRTGDLSFLDDRSPGRCDVRASADGRLFTLWRDSSKGVSELTFIDDAVNFTYQPHNINYLAPSADGTVLYSAFGRLLPNARSVDMKKPVYQNEFLFPAAHAKLYLQITRTNSTFLKYTTAIGIEGETAPLFKFADRVVNFETDKAVENLGVPDDRRVMLIPNAGALVILSKERNRLELYQVNFAEAYDKSAIERPFVASQPPFEFAPGQAMEYQIAARSKKGNLTYRLDLGPQGMSIGADGRLTWTVPKDFSEKEVDVALMVADADKQESAHRFRLKLKEKDELELVRDGKIDLFEVPNLPNRDHAAPIKPVNFKEDKRILRLPGAVGNSCIGANGRYIILHLPQHKKIAIFDVNETRIIRYLPVAEDNISMAAGRDKLFVALPGAGIIQRYSLATFDQEVTVPAPIQEANLVLGMGHDSAGPLLIGGYTPDGQRSHTGAGGFYDARTFRELKFKVDGHQERVFGVGLEGNQVRATPDGKLFTAWGLDRNASSIRITGNVIKPAAFDAAVWLAPAADGKMFYTAAGRWLSGAERVGQKNQSYNEHFIPSVHGDFYLHFKISGFGGRVQQTAALHLAGNDVPLLTFPEDRFLPRKDLYQPENALLEDRRFILIPDAHLLAVVSSNFEKLELYRLNFDELLDKSGFDYLLLASRPPTEFIPGKIVEYQVAVKSKKGGAVYRLAAGPQGMAIAADGRLSWTVPRDFKEKEVDVILAIKDASGKEIFHSFTLKRNVPSNGEVAPENPDPDVAKDPPPVIPELRPALPIKPAPLQADKETVQLPSKIKNACMGANGRFLIMHLPDQRQLAVFDVNEAKIVKYLPVSEDAIGFTAGLHNLFVALPQAGAIERYSLATLEKDATIRVPPKGKQLIVAMGHASNGPLLIMRRGGERIAFGLSHGFYDPTTLKELKIKVQDRVKEGFAFQLQENVRVSANGQVFAMWGEGSPAGVAIMTVSGNNTACSYAHKTAGFLAPNYYGNIIYSADGRWNPEAVPLEGRKRLMVPAAHGDFYLELSGLKGDYKTTLNLEGGAQPITTLADDLFVLGESVFRQADALDVDRRCMLVPAANLIAVIAPTRDRLDLHRLDFYAALEKSEIDFFLVTSQPPLEFTPGKPLDYQIEFKSKKGGVEFQLKSGPREMTISPQGKLTWPVPEKIPDDRVAVKVIVTDASAKQVQHTFQLTASGRKEPEAKTPEPRIDNPPVQKQPVIPKPDPKSLKDPKQPNPPLKKEFDEARWIPEGVAKGIPLVRPAAEAVPIKPAALRDDRSVIKLPSAVQNICVGGGGRYLFLHVPREKKIGVFDASDARIVKWLPMPDDNIFIAASMTKLMVVLKDKNIVQRWSLTSFEKETQAPVTVEGKITSVGMGYAADGPLILSGVRGRYTGNRLGLTFIDSQSLKEVWIAKGQGVFSQGLGALRVSGNGRVVTASANNSNFGSQLLELTGNAIRGQHLYEDAAMWPGPDGRRLFSYSGVVTSESRPIVRDRILSIPALQGDFYLGLSRDEKDKNNVDVFVDGETRSLMSFTDIETAQNGSRPDGPIPVEFRLYLIPEARLLAALSPACDSLVVQRFDLDDSLAKSGRDFLFVTSQPVVVTQRGADYQYAVRVKSKKGDVKYALEAGPSGMSVAGDGRISWSVPKDFTEKEAPVILSVNDSSGQEVLHEFSVRVSDASGVPAPMPKIDAPDPKIPAPKPAPPVGTIKPAPLKSDRDEVQLTSPIKNLCVGGGGRFLILHLATERKLAIFDFNEAKVVSYIALASDYVHFAAGKSKLIVVQGDYSLFRSYSLATFEKELTVSPPFRGLVTALAMGADSEGPVLVQRRREEVEQPAIGFLDVTTLKDAGVVMRERNGWEHGSFENPGHFRAAADGSVFGFWRSGVSPSGLATISLEEGTVRTRYEHTSVFHIAPSPDGQFLYTGSGILTNRLQPVGAHKKFPPQFYVPSAHGNFCLHLAGNNPDRAWVHGAGNDRALAVVDLTSVGSLHDQFAQQILSPDKRIHFVPSAHTIVTIAPSNTKLILHRFNLDEALAKSGVDFLYVTNQPISSVTHGAAYECPILVKSKRGGVRFRIESGPLGMKVAPDGMLTWVVPKDFRAKEASVVLIISDSAGQEIPYSFTIAVKD